MKTVISRKENELKINVDGLWDMYEALFDNCKTKEEVNLLLENLNGLHDLIADARTTQIEKKTKDRKVS